MFKNLMGDKKFYGMVLKIAIPIIIQMAITNLAYASSLKETEVVKKGIWIQNVVVHNSITEE